jgi:carbamoyl-phosphate synthase large subunit
MRARRGAGGRGSSKIESYDMGLHWFNYWQTRKTDWEFIAQKYLSGRDFAFQSLWNNGELIVSQVRERLELIYAYLAVSQKTGTPTIAKTVHRDDINEAATKAILAIDNKATGIFCADLTEDEEGKPVVSEINPARFFTTSFFFTRAGCNMPYYYIKLGFGEKLPELKKYNALDEGIYWIRHIDCPNILLKEGEWRANEF